MPPTEGDEPHSRTGLNLVPTGISGLDDILGGGLDADRLYLVEGRPGTGKTTLALQYLLEGVRRGERGLYVTLSESEAELRVVAMRHGWSLDELSIFELIPPEASLADDRELTIFQPAELELSETTKLILGQVNAISPARIVFDSLSEMRLLAQDALRYRRQILALKQFFIGRKSTVLLLDDLTSQAIDLQLHSIAHGVVTLEQLALDVRSRTAASSRHQDARHVVQGRLSRFHDCTRRSHCLSTTGRGGASARIFRRDHVQRKWRA